MACWCKGKCPHIGRAIAMMKENKPQRARFALRNSLCVAPLCVEGNFMLANLLCGQNHADIAMVHIDRAAQQADPGRVHYERGRVYRAQLKLPEAEREFFAALQASPESEVTAASLLGTYEAAGNFKAAGELAKAARAKFPGNTDLRRLEAVVLDAQGDAAGAAALLLAPAGEPPLVPTELLDRGRYKEKLGDYAGAWGDWMAGKNIMAERFGHRYDLAYYTGYFSRLRDAATAPLPNFYRRAPDLETDPAPLFVCGYPRSGTTLVETILSSHSAVEAGDELSGLQEVIESMSAFCKVRAPYPAALMATGLGENFAAPALLRDLYMRNAQNRIGFKPRPALGPPPQGLKRTMRRTVYFTDKMPLNEIHLPLLRVLFPAAPILRMVRHPLDVMVSCMSNWLVHGGFYASSLESCATHYRQIDELIQHYEKQFALQDRRGFQNVRYETLVREPAAAIPELLRLARLEPEKACLEPHKNKRTARTLSYRAVKQPITGGRVDRWKNFRDQLAPAVEILRPILEREGYEF